MKKRQILLISLLVLTVVVVGAFKLFNSGKVLGTQTDEHGCNTSRGAAWCDTEQRCIQKRWEICTDEKTVITNIVSNFYKKYNLCIGNPPIQAKGNIAEYCRKNTGYTTENFLSNLYRNGTASPGVDPINCVNNTPKSYFINNVEITDNIASASSEEELESDKLVAKVAVAKENGLWKVDNVLCP